MRMAGFSLVELSIVLVILGLLTGGILGGQNLMRAAELRSIIQEYETYQIAVKNFQDKYFALPGDMINATQFWGRADDGTFSGQCADPGEDVGTGTQTCNGDGDSFVNAHEEFRFWQHLANADMVQGSYTGIHGSINGVDSVVGENVPRSKVSSAGWHVQHLGTQTGTPARFAHRYDNTYLFGGQDPGNTTRNPVLKPEEAWNIDVKIDDGRPAYGKVAARYPQTCANATNGNDVDVEYDLQNTNVACALYFSKAF